jgi:outer membrane protein assembly factor BamC
VAPTLAGQIRVERVGNSRWLSVPMTPEQLWPQLRQFWQNNGMALEIDRPEIGLMETGWAENRAKLPQDVVRRTLGKVFDSAFDSGERDRFRTRVERGSAGTTEVHISHRGAEEMVNPNTKEYVGWKVRANDPALEAEMLARLMLALGQPAGVVKPDAKRIEEAVQAVNQAPATPGLARQVEGQPAVTIELAEGFDRAWRRVGQALGPRQLHPGRPRPQSRVVLRALREPGTGRQGRPQLPAAHVRRQATGPLRNATPPAGDFG